MEKLVARREWRSEKASEHKRRNKGVIFFLLCSRHEI